MPRHEGVMMMMMMMVLVVGWEHEWRESGM